MITHRHSGALFHDDHPRCFSERDLHPLLLNDLFALAIFALLLTILATRAFQKRLSLRRISCWDASETMLIKEFIQVFRDKRTRFLLFGPPVIQMLIFGYAATLEIRHVPTAVLDYDNSQESRDLIVALYGQPLLRRSALA